jgi:hypothetical protein
VTRFPDRRRLIEEESDWSLPPQKPKLAAKVAFLTDGRAVSYAETFLSLVATHQLGPIVGGPTAGSNGGVSDRTNRGCNRSRPPAELELE